MFKNIGVNPASYKAQNNHNIEAKERIKINQLLLALHHTTPRSGWKKIFIHILRIFEEDTIYILEVMRKDLSQ